MNTICSDFSQTVNKPSSKPKGVTSAVIRATWAAPQFMSSFRSMKKCIELLWKAPMPPFYTALRVARA